MGIIQLQKVSKLGLGVTAGIFAFVGIWMLRSSQAATVPVAIEPELGQVTAPAKISQDANASGGKSVVFNPLALTTLNDEFDGPAGTAPNAAIWGHDVGNGTQGWGNQELQYYTADNSNSYLDGTGKLVLLAKASSTTAYKCWNGTCQYTSAKLLTKNKFTKAYGHFEARIQFPDLQNGLWPAFWMLGANIDTVGFPQSGEIDIVENYGWEAIESSLHGPVPAKDFAADYGLSNHNPKGWHTYAMDWTPTQVTFLIDGTPFGNATKAQMGENWAFDHPFYLILNLAVGGLGTGGRVPANLPAKVLIDFIRVE